MNPPVVILLGLQLVLLLPVESAMKYNPVE